MALMHANFANPHPRSQENCLPHSSNRKQKLASQFADLKRQEEAEWLMHEHRRIEAPIETLKRA